MVAIAFSSTHQAQYLWRNIYLLSLFFKFCVNVIISALISFGNCATRKLFGLFMSPLSFCPYVFDHIKTRILEKSLEKGSFVLSYL